MQALSQLSYVPGPFAMVAQLTVGSRLSRQRLRPPSTACMTAIVSSSKGVYDRVWQIEDAALSPHIADRRRRSRRGMYAMAISSTDDEVADRSHPIVRAGERLVRRIEALVDEVAKLRSDNEQLRVQVREAVTLFDRATAALGEASPPRRSRTLAIPSATAAPLPRRRKTRARGPKGRATPPEVTTEVVRAVIAKLGDATASEIATEITKAGVKVSGRAVRFLAERAGAQTFRGDDGQRRYRL
jgi:hypothetical protein